MKHIPDTTLWIGNVGDVWDLNAIYAEEIRAIVDFAKNEPIPKLGREFVYCRFPIVDNVNDDVEIIELAIATLAGLLRAGMLSLVYCSNGESRSPVIAAAALSIFSENPIDEQLAKIAELCSVDVSPGLWNQVYELLNGENSL